MDLNAAFANHWDKKNPSNFVEACNRSRELREYEERRLRNIKRSTLVYLEPTVELKGHGQINPDNNNNNNNQGKD